MRKLIRVPLIVFFIAWFGAFLVAPRQAVPAQALDAPVVCTVDSSWDLRVAIGKGSTCDKVIVIPGDYHSNLYWFDDDGLVLECQVVNECSISSMIIRGDNNTVRGFDIWDHSTQAVRIYGDGNLFELNQIHDMGQDCWWIWGQGNVIRRNYCHHIWFESWLEGPEPYDNHVDGGMTWAWQPDPDVTLAEDILFEENIIDMHRPNGSNQFYIVTIRPEQGPIVPRNFTFKDNIFICRDGGYCPVGLYNDPQGFRFFGNDVYNTTNTGSAFVYNGYNSECAGNNVYGYAYVGCDGPGNTVQEFTSLPEWYDAAGHFWPGVYVSSTIPTQIPTSTPEIPTNSDIPIPVYVTGDHVDEKMGLNERCEPSLYGNCTISFQLPSCKFQPERYCNDVDYSVWVYEIVYIDRGFFFQADKGWWGRTSADGARQETWIPLFLERNGGEKYIFTEVYLEWLQ